MIIPILKEDEQIAIALDCLLEQIGNFEVIVVAGRGVEPAVAALVGQIRVISCAGATRCELLNSGAAIARGDILLFLWPGSRLPPQAMPAIEHNFQLLPQTIAGNFHVKFDDQSLYTKLLTRLLKHRRYRGRYYGNSGIFVRKAVYEALGGFQSYPVLEDYDFARRLEKYGPTLYLPDAIIASAHKFRNKKIKAALTWVIVQSLFALGVSPHKLGRLWAKI